MTDELKAAPGTLSVKPWEQRINEYFANGSVPMRTFVSFKDEEIADWRALAAAGNSQGQDAVDAARYRWLRDKTIVVSWSYQDGSGNIINCVSSEVRMDSRIDFAIAAMGKQEGGEGA